MYKTLSADSGGSGTLYYYDSDNNDVRLVFSAGTGGGNNAAPEAIAESMVDQDIWSNAKIYGSADASKETYLSTLGAQKDSFISDADYTMYVFESASVDYTKEIIGDNKGYFDVVFCEPARVNNPADTKNTLAKIDPNILETLKTNGGAIYGLESVSGLGNVETSLGFYLQLAEGGNQVYLITNPSFKAHAIEGPKSTAAPSSMFVNPTNPETGNYETSDVAKMILGASGDLSLDGYRCYDLSSLLGEPGDKIEFGYNSNHTVVNMITVTHEDGTKSEYKVIGSGSSFDIVDENGSVQISIEDLRKNAYSRYLSSKQSGEPVKITSYELQQLRSEYGMKSSSLYLPAENPGGVDFDFSKALEEISNLSGIIEMIEEKRITLGGIDFSKVKNVEKPNCPSCMNNI